jgi:hypothetical protein
MGIAGAGVILWWARGLLLESARVLLDREMDAPVVPRIREAIESDGDSRGRRPARLARRPREPRRGDHRGRREPRSPDEYRARAGGNPHARPRVGRGQPLPHETCA